MALKKFCRHLGCQEIVDDGYCAKHEKDKYAYDQYRPSSHQRGYNSRWRAYSKAFLKRNPLCACDDCKKRPVPLPAEVTDHIVPHKGDPVLFWDPSNHQPMAKRCHDKKTAREDGGFGR